METVPFRNLIGAGATWSIGNRSGPDNGLPTGGTASGYSSGTGRPLSSPGFGVVEASLGSQVNAFDGAALLFVNNQIFVAPATVDISGVTATGGYSIITAGPVALSDLNVTTQFYADQTLPVLRTFVSFTNPTAAAITVPVALATNVGSDADTIVQATSSGDRTFDLNDRWIITDDNLLNGDLTDTHVLAGPGNPSAVPAAVSQTVFDYYPFVGTEGVLANYAITIPANSTRHLLFFNGVNETNADAVSTAPIYSNLQSLQGSTLLNGLTVQQLANTLNWDSLVPKISVNNVSVTEGNFGNQFATFNLSLSAASGKPIAVDYATADAAATAAQDYQPLAGTITFNPGETVRTVTVAIKGDAIVEPNEVFSLNLSNAQNALIEIATGLGTILNDDQEAPPVQQVGGSAQPDILKSGAGDSLLTGEAGDDTITGGAGNDILVGGLGRDIMTGGLGADRFHYSVLKGRPSESSLRRAGGRAVPLDHITDLNPNEGDRIALNDGLLTRRPPSVANAGQLQRRSRQVPSIETLRRNLPKVYADKNLVRRGSQAVRPHEAVFFQLGSRSYLSVNDSQKAFSLTRDLVVDVTGMQFLPGDTKVKTLSVQNYFA